MISQYALNSDGKLVFVDDVENGLKCNCTCPSCGEKMLAKNGGSDREHHFSHESGHDCDGYRETLLHIWSKQIIEEHKSLSIPIYKGIDGGCILINPYDEKDFSLPEQKLHFTSVEIEKRTDISELQPDIVGVTEEGLRLWIEVFVTHKCSEKKISMIKKDGINCIEIRVPKSIETKKDLSVLLLDYTGTDFKSFLNYPYGDNIIRKSKWEFYYELKANCKQVTQEECDKCFEDNVLQISYNKLIDEYKGKIPASYNYIFKFAFLKDLIGKYPNLKYLPNAIFHKEFGKLEVAEIEFAHKLGHLIELYGYGSIRSFHWNCPHIYAYSIKDNKECVFCLNKNGNGF